MGKAANIYEAGYKLNGSALVISKHIGNTWLWDRVRVSGGAYGGFCDFDTHSGMRLCTNMSAGPVNVGTVCLFFVVIVVCGSIGQVCSRIYHTATRTS